MINKIKDLINNNNNNKFKFKLNHSKINNNLQKKRNLFQVQINSY